MPPSADRLEQRIMTLERSLHRARLVSSIAALAAVVLAAAAFTHSYGLNSDEIRTHRLLVVDDHNQVRLQLGQDPPSTQRVSRAAGLTLYDERGVERGGFTTMVDGSVVLGMDAPVGAGASMRDRIGLKVFPNGSAYIMLIDNKTAAVARLLSEEGPSGTRGIQVFKWEPDRARHYTRTITYDGDVRAPTGR